MEHQLSRDSTGGVNYTSPKTYFGKRTVALGEKTLAILHTHFQRQHILKTDAGEKWVDHGLIFTTTHGSPINHRNLTREFKQLLKVARLADIRFHALRHPSASLLLNNNVAPFVVSRRLGHAKASITLDIYGHLIPSMQEEAAKKIDDMVTPISVQQALVQPIANVSVS